MTTGGAAAVRVAPGVARLTLAARTLPPFDATNVWLLTSADRAALVDPGFRDPADVARVAEALGGRELKMVLLSHTHPDHVAGLPAVLERFGSVPVYVHPAEAERVPGDADVRALQGGRALMLAGRLVRAVHTPGHAPGHLAFHLPDVGGVLAGDLLTARGSTWVGLPEGDAGAYLASLDALEELAPGWIGVAHGTDPGPPGAAIARARRGRHAREAAIEEALRDTLRLDELRARVYGDVAEGPARALVDASLLAHLQRLMATLRVLHLGEGSDGPYRRRA